MYDNQVLEQDRVAKLYKEQKEYVGSNFVNKVILNTPVVLNVLKKEPEVVADDDNLEDTQIKSV